jgi:putative membrane protein
MGRMMGWYGSGMGWGGWIMMTLAMLSFWGLVAFAVVAIARSLGRRDGPTEPPAGRDPLNILAERFARGEIDADEYEARAEALRHVRAGASHETTD